MLNIKNLHVQASSGAKILKGVNLEVKAGEIHAIMGLNGSGKSTLVKTLAGHPQYEPTAGGATLDGEDLLAMDPEVRAQRGVFLAFQYPVEIHRSVNVDFSGGEKKRNEILQMAILDPKVALLDETDSGLDIDALRIVAGGINKLATADNAVVMVTHYQRLLDYVQPHFVHVMAEGRLVRSGGPELALELEARGYKWLQEELEAAR
jgi:Fe-S cluster assembly ATP-binding protein